MFFLMNLITLSAPSVFLLTRKTYAHYKTRQRQLTELLEVFKLIMKSLVFTLQCVLFLNFKEEINQSEKINPFRLLCLLECSSASNVPILFVDSDLVVIEQFLLLATDIALESTVNLIFGHLVIHFAFKINREGVLKHVTSDYNNIISYQVAAEQICDVCIHGFHL